MSDINGTVIGIADFSDGEILIPRVNTSGPVLELCSGYTSEQGRLVPEGLVEPLSATALDGTLPEQTPFAFVQDDRTTIIARDSNNHLRTMDSEGVWSGPLGVCAMLPESTPTRWKNQLIIPTADGLKIFEPDSPTTKLRPLSLKGPGEYVASARPVTTPAALAHQQLFGAADWSPVGAGTAVSVSGNKMTLTLGSTAGANAQVAKRSLGGGQSLAGKAFLLFDVMIENDPQAHYIPGRFVNDAMLWPSGYEIGLYSDTGCETEVARISIPQCLPLGMVSRVAYNLGASTELIKGIAILTASFWTPPTESFAVSLFAEAFVDDWSHKGNVLLPAVTNKVSPLYAALAQVAEAQPGQALPQSATTIADASFEATTGWVLGDGASQKSSGDKGFAARTGSKYVELDNYHNHAGSEYVQQASIPVQGGRTYAIEMWYHMPWPGTRTGFVPPEYNITVTPNTGGTAQTTTHLANVTNTWTQRRVLWTAPLGAVTCTLKISVSAGYWYGFGIDDISMYAVNQAAPGSVTVLQQFSEVGADRTPATPLVRYCYAFAGRDALADDAYSLMVSNPSDASASLVSDPWRSMGITVFDPVGAISEIAATPYAGGSGYTVDDVLTIAGGVGGTVKVVSVTDVMVTGEVTAVELVDAGAGYSFSGNMATTGGTGTGCTISVVAVTDGGAITEYGDYLTHALIYRQVYNGASKTWSTWQFVTAVPMAASVAITDDGKNDEPVVLDRDAPAEREIANAPASSARYAVTQGGRVYSACLDYNASAQRWVRPLAAQISSYNKPWAHPTLVTEYTQATDGTEIDAYAINGATVRGMAVWNEDVILFLDTELFHLRGEDPINGWRLIGNQQVACKSNRSIAIAGKSVIWHDGEHFVVYGGGMVEPVSRFAIDSSSIDWTAPHNAVYLKGKYMFFCEAGGQNILMILDTKSGAWRRRMSDALANVVGICTDGQIVYGLTSTGEVVDLFGGDSDHGAATVVREVYTRYIRLAPPGRDMQINQLVLDVTGASGTIAAEVRGIGTKNSVASRSIVIDTTRTRQTVGLNIRAEAVSVALTITGSAPVIHYIGFDRDEVFAQ